MLNRVQPYTPGPILENFEVSLLIEIAVRQAVEAFQRGEIASVKETCESVLKQAPKQAKAMQLLGAIAMIEAAKADEATRERLTQSSLRWLRKAVAVEPNNPEMLTNLGTTQRHLGQFEEAEHSFKKALRLNPNYALALDGLGHVLWQLSRAKPLLKEKAEEHFKKAISINPNLDVAYMSLAQLSEELDDPAQAVFYGERALVTESTVQALVLLARNYERLGQIESAEKCLLQALEKYSDSSFARLAYARFLLEQLRFAEALEQLSKTTIGSDSSSEFLCAICDAQEGMQRWEDAAQTLRRLLSMSPSSYGVFRMAANRLRAGDKDMARTAIIEAVKSDLTANQAGKRMITGCIGFIEGFKYDWVLLNEALDFFWAVISSAQGIDIEAAVVQISPIEFRLVGRAKKRPAPQQLIHFHAYLLDLHYRELYTQAEIFDAHRSYGEALCNPAIAGLSSKTNFKTKPIAAKKLRIGYLSQDFRSHSVAYFIESILATHNEDQVEVFGYYNYEAEDELTHRIKDHCRGGWRKTKDWSDKKLQQSMLNDRIDILVDLMGHTGENRLPAIASRLAPIQIAYLGYPDTTGVKAVDYRITDAYVEPEGSERYSTEALIRMPASYFCYRPSDAARSTLVGPLPASSRGYVTFGSFNIYQKITDDQIRIWAQILGRTPGSKLLVKVRLFDDSIRNLKSLVLSRFETLGIPRERVILRDFARSLEVALKIYDEVDLCLDTFPYSGATTTCESLWMGCPVVSRYGETHASRMSLSILSAVGLGDLAVVDSEAYVDAAVRLAEDLPALAAMRASMRDRLANSPLMDAKGFTRRLEEVYRSVWTSWCEEQTP